MTLTFWILFTAGVLLSAAGGILLKLGAVGIQYDAGVIAILFQLIGNWKIMLGGICYVIPLFIWIYMLKKVDLSFLQPLFSLVYVVTPILAMLILHEHVPAARWLGIAVIVAGVVLVAQT